ncbi:phospholipase D-like domain-containing protein [Nocardioides sp. SR21]|uniref:phospholipase D-like domain-containing protein n=1 Tax=Nocardioides sp. SR21 TaxID=2919501 RepID=UPI001FAB2285|nr:phospholipase D-like domain-containing protein [Nocardioides sp. SR21]
MARFLALLVAVSCLVMPSAGSPATAAPTVATAATTAAAAAPDRYKPRPGPTFNSPLGDTNARRMIFHKIMRSINSSPRGSEIQILTWNFLTSAGTDALLAAQRRGVKVMVLMDATNNDEDLVNGPFRRLRYELREGNEKAPKGRKSWARMCANSCRGPGGAAHAKLFMFSRVGDTRRVVMQGSANFTLASTNNQWNDIYTHTRTRSVWRFYDRVFHQAALDKKARRPYVSQDFKGFRLIMFPLAAQRDPVMDLLNKVKCWEATNTPSGRTIIRMAPDVIRQSRGLALARKVRELWDRGCDIKIGYTVVGIDVGRVLRNPAGRGPIPMKHLTQDFDEDGAFDNYFHLKAMSIVGNVRGDRSGYVVLNGSANWSSLAKNSDENLGIYWSKHRTLQYQQHIDYWYTNFPKPPVNDNTNDPTTDPNNARRMPTTRVAGPDDLVFGTGANAVFEDGTPYSRTGVDPYANLDLQ